MNKASKVVMICVLALGTALFGGWFYASYNRFMDEASKVADQDRVENLTQTGKSRITPQGYSKVMILGAVFVVFALGLGILGGHKLSDYVAERTVKHLYDDIAESTSKDYDVAEEAWANGDFLEAINLLRAYLEENPKQIHVAIRIAEIYEKDLSNPLAAALEYEEVLKHKLSPEQWGWTAIHLCNLYIAKLNQKNKAVALLLRIDAEYGETSAAEKARKRLAMFATEAVNSGELTGIAAEPIEEETTAPSDDDSNTDSAPPKKPKRS
jgi:uncharacterized protein YneF (UPF0154 family)